MIELYIKDIFNTFNITPTQLNIAAVKGLIASLLENDLAMVSKQKVLIDEKLFLNIWYIYLDTLNFFDPNYNRRSDFKLYFNYIINSLIKKEKIKGFALFCPGYTKNGYKDYLGTTNKRKLYELKRIVELLKMKEIDINIYNYYSDVFLENTDYQKNQNWYQEMIENRKMFYEEALKYFDSKYIKSISELEIFSSKASREGYINKEIIKSVNPRTYAAFKKVNKKFYEKLNFTEEAMIYRNDRLITMYKMLSDFINTQKNIIFLPMENMYERENIFSENGTCTMYLKLKKKV